MISSTRPRQSLASDGDSVASRSLVLQLILLIVQTRLPLEMGSLSKNRTWLFPGLIGLAIGCVSGGFLGASVMWSISQVTENPEEPAWRFAGAMVGLIFGMAIGSVLGFIFGVLSSNLADAKRRFFKSESQP